MYEFGDALLFTLSAWRHCTWRQFRRAFDDLHARFLATGGAVATDDDAYVRSNTARLLDSLGHCDSLFDPGGGGSVLVAPSVLARLPVAGLPRAVLCGSRSPETLEAFQRAKERAGGSVQVRDGSQGSLNAFAPTRIEVQAVSDAAMGKLSADVGVIYVSEPPAWSLAQFSGSLESFLGLLRWRTRPDLTWARADFDPAGLRFAGERDSEALILSRYQDPVSGRWSFWLRRGDECAEIDDPSWGRYAVLAEHRRRVLQFDAATGELAVPASSPLPRLIARAATLASGYAPRTVVSVDGESGLRRRLLVYGRVPVDVWERLAMRVGQLSVGGGDR